ncbi:hypothetical protein KBB25_02555 [Candidatus Gracilibacteria bacterium]|nr:hypothetical protein [Candidatus Gracilibacteria bacterium]
MEHHDTEHHTKSEDASETHHQDEQEHKEKIHHHSESPNEKTSQHTSIALSAWEMVTNFPSLKKLNFFPSFIGMFWLMMIIVYQVVFTYVIIFQKKDAFMESALELIHKDYFGNVLIFFGTIFILYIFISPLTEGGMIEMIHSYKKTKGAKVHRTFQGIFDGFRHFLPLFEAHNVIAIFRPLTIITFYIMLLRLFGREYLAPVSYVMLVYLIFAFFMNMCFAYVKFFIIFENKAVIPALSASTNMAMRHIGITMRLYSTMILLYLRTLLVALIFLGIPFAISGIIALFTIVGVQIFLLSIFGIITLVLFIIIVHLNSTLEIFIEATWYEGYQLCKAEDKEDGHGDHGHDDHGHDTHKTGHDDHGHH